MMDTAPGRPANDLGWSPHTSTSAAYANTASPSVTINAAWGVVVVATSPASNPTTAATATAASSPSPCGSAVRNDEAHMAPTTANAPCAKFTTRVARYTATSPLPTSAYPHPVPSPVTR